MHLRSKYSEGKSFKMPLSSSSPAATPGVHHSRSLSLPQMDLLQVQEASTTLMEREKGTTHLQQQQQQPNEQQQSNSSSSSSAPPPFWFTQPSESELARVTAGYNAYHGGGGSGQGGHGGAMDPTLPRPPQFSMLHAAAITGDRSGLQKLAAGNFCDIDLRDKVNSCRFKVLYERPSSSRTKSLLFFFRSTREGKKDPKRKKHNWVNFFPFFRRRATVYFCAQEGRGAEREKEPWFWRRENLRRRPRRGEKEGRKDSL